MTKIRKLDTFLIDSNGKNFFFINTPFQFMLACMISKILILESKFVVVTDYHNSIKQIQNIQRILECPPVKYLYKSKSNIHNRLQYVMTEIKKVIKMVRLKQSLDLKDNIWIGLLTVPVNYPIIFDKSFLQRIILFDDGSGTIPFLNERSKGNTWVNFPKTKSNPVTWFYPNRMHIDSVKYLTIYPGLYGAPNDMIAHLDLKLPKQIVRKKKEVPELWFIGGPVVQTNIISKEHYNTIISHLINESNHLGLRFIYFRHRTEKISLPKSIEIREVDLPFELFFAKTDNMPKAVISIISSVVLNMVLFFKDTYPPVFYIKLDKKCPVKRALQIQTYAEDILNIPVLELNDLIYNLRKLM